MKVVLKIGHIIPIIVKRVLESMFNFETIPFNEIILILQKQKNTSKFTTRVNREVIS